MRPDQGSDFICQYTLQRSLCVQFNIRQYKSQMMRYIVNMSGLSYTSFFYCFNHLETSGHIKLRHYDYLPRRILQSQRHLVSSHEGYAQHRYSEHSLICNRANDCFRWRMGSSAARTRQGQSTRSRSNTEILVGEVAERPVTALSLVGEAYPDVKEESGGDRYNVKLVFTLPQKEGEEGGAQVKISFRKLEPSDSLYRCRTL